MKVKLHTGGKSHFTDAEWQQIHDAFEFFISKYKMGRYTIPVYVIFPENIKHKDETEKTYGLCVTHYKHYGIAIRPRRFVVKISANNHMHKIVKLIFHEMTHVLQEMRGDFKNPNDGGLFYQNVYYSVDTLTKASYEEYRTWPWEIEAWSVSEQLLAEWYATGNTKRTVWQKLMSLFGV